VKKFLAFMKPNAPLHIDKKPATGPYCGPEEATAPTTYVFKTQTHIKLYIKVRLKPKAAVTKVYSSLRL
jgi:hypothetical protein